MEFTLSSDVLTRTLKRFRRRLASTCTSGIAVCALESAVDYTTDLTAQYELGFNTVNDVNFSMETAHCKEPNLTTSSDSDARQKTKDSKPSAADPELR